MESQEEPPAKKTMKEMSQKVQRWQEFESKALALFCRDNQAALFGSGGGAGIESTKRKAWNAATEQIRAAGGMVRDWQTTRKKWQDLCYRAKVYKNKRDGKRVTGGGPQPNMNSLHELVLDCMPDEVVEGVITNGACETIPQSQTQEVPPIHAQQQHKKQHSSKKAKGKKKGFVKSKEVKLLHIYLNKDVLYIEKEKLAIKKQALEYQKQTVEVL